VAVRAPVPRQVPDPPRTFTGRLAELAELSVPAAIRTIVGPGGVGKTWLAQRWAHEHRSRYPDGQLYVDLRGFDPAGAPMAPSMAVRGFLNALGVAPEAVPADIEVQTALYRSLVADKRLLIVLDNARDSVQATRLLPGTATCTVLVTSRHQLVGLVTTHGARPLALGLLTDHDAHRLLAGHLGNGRVTAEPDAVAALLRHCAGLPLALGIVAARAVAHPGMPLAALAAELDEATTRLDALDAGELAVNLRAVLSCSTESLAPPAARLFALLGLAPGPDIGLAAAASLAGLPVTAARVLLRQLRTAHLVDEPEPGRYRMHDLLRLYAAERAETLSERSAARRRVLDHYLHTGYTANRLLAPFQDAIELAPAAPGVTPAPASDHLQARAWFAAEHANLLTAIDQATGEGLDEHVWQLAWTIATHLDRNAHWQDRATVHTTALAAARRLGDRCAQAYALRGLARAQIWLGHYHQARVQLHDALHLLDNTSDLGQQAHIHRALARSYARAGQPARALQHDKQALWLYEAAEHRCGQATALNAIGWHHAHLGEYDQALRLCERALALHQEMGDRNGAAATCDSLGYIHRHLARYDRAVVCYRRAVELFDEVGDRYQEADSLANLGDTYAAAGRPDQARETWRRATAILDQLGVSAARPPTALHAAQQPPAAQLVGSP
jgi:tetratricopeptide (TPR) repeat protein